MFSERRTLENTLLCSVICPSIRICWFRFYISVNNVIYTIKRFLRNGIEFRTRKNSLIWYKKMYWTGGYSSYGLIIENNLKSFCFPNRQTKIIWKFSVSNARQFSTKRFRTQFVWIVIELFTPAWTQFPVYIKTFAI